MQSLVQQIQAIYRATARDYDRLFSPYRLRQFAVLADELGLEGHEHALDVGCGPGQLTLVLARSLPHGSVVGVDVSEQVLALARDKARRAGVHNASFVHGDALALPFGDGVFDLVVSSFLLPWVPDPDRALHEMRRVLRRGGRLGLVTAGREFYEVFFQALEKVIRAYPEHYGRVTTADDLIGAHRYKGRELQERLEELKFSVHRRFHLTVEIPITSGAYLQRVNAITAELYLSPLPEPQRQRARRMLRGELERLGRSGEARELLASECALILVGIHEGA